MLSYLIIVISLFSFGQSSTEECRTAFHAALNNEQALKAFVSENNESQSSLVRAYVGVAITIQAEYTPFPNKKYAYFTDGKDQLEGALKDAPNNPEIRYLRMLVQLKAPTFLLYYADIDDDMGVFSKNIKSYPLTVEWKIKMIDYLILTNELSSSQKNRLTELKSNLACWY